MTIFAWRASLASEARNYDASCAPDQGTMGPEAKQQKAWEKNPGMGGLAEETSHAAPTHGEPSATYSAADVNQVRNGPYSRSPLHGGVHPDGRTSAPAATDSGVPGAPASVHPVSAPIDPSARQVDSGAPPASASVPNAAPTETEGHGATTSPLASMLREKRRETRRAMEPFGGAKNNHPPAPHAAEDGRPPGDADNPSGPFIEDDSEVLDAATSPGLGRLE
ncbi:hypothetical protein AK812_SmicGene7916 [Symbiodinium microadriaticum]|uniref:Uncharacterized protein n=1 Tax=Symbiodinium microadriaticum TaxID=2951 RepID=A0A1Q9EMF1_SYMMI|nr:hypothetical protein AK812_SmicGene7916 [Symbiodinium microadriaticum]